MALFSWIVRLLHSNWINKNHARLTFPTIKWIYIRDPLLLEMRRYFYLVLSFTIFCFLVQDISAQLVINEVLINATTANNDGSNSPNTGEWTELLNNSASALDISCYVMTDGDWSVTFPPGTILPPYGIITIGSPFSQIPGLDINLATCNCTSGPTNQIGIFTNGDEQLIIADNTGLIVDGIYWGSGQFAATPSFTTSNLFGCSSVTIPIIQSNPLIQQITGSIGESETVYLPCDGTGIVLSGNTNPTPDAPNNGPIQIIDPNENIIHESCGVLGSISINPTGGVGPYTYQWTGASGTSTSVSGLQDGNYSVAITDQGQCNAIQNFPFVVLQNNSVNISITVSNSTICAGQSTELTASGGSNYTWINTATLSASTGAIVTATPTLSTTYTVQDNTAGCINTADITIQVNNIPFTNPSYNNPLCEGDQLTLFSNTTSGTASWTGPNGFSSSLMSPSISNIAQSQAGTYTLTLTENNCSATFTLPVSIDTPTIPTINAAGPFCSGDAPIDLNASAEPGTWTGPGITNTNTGMFDPSIANIGNNNIVFQSNNYCTAPANAILVINSNGDASISPTGNLCETTPPFALQTVTAGGIWSGNGVSNLGIVSPGILGPGNYQATYTLTGGCGATETLNFIVHPTPQPTMSVSESAVCIPAEVELNATNALDNWQCEWWVDGVLIGTDCNNQSFSVEETNCQDVQLLVTDGMGCSGSSTEINMFCGQWPPVAAFAVDPEQPFATDDQVNYIDLSTGSTQIEWEIEGLVFNTPGVAYPINGTEGTLQSCLTAINSIGCENKVCRIINIMDDYGVYVPTAFTPNEDGFNDGFGPVLYNLKGDDLNYSFSIFSRDGERVFHSANPKQKWHGNKDGGDIYVLQDSYVWVLELNMPGEEEQKVFRGDVKILR